MQPRYNLLFRIHERDLLPLCGEERVAVIPYNPLAGGLLTGKHDRSAPPPEGSRFTLGWAGSIYQERYWTDKAFDTVDKLRAVAERAGLSMPALAVRWVMSNPAVTAPIVGASRPEQLADSLAAAEAGPLPDDVKAELDEITAEFRLLEDTPLPRPPVR